MSRRIGKHYNDNVIIDNKVVSISDLQTNAKSASTRFLVLILGIVMLASMVVPYLSMAAAATSSSEAFNGTVIPGYSMGGLELTAYGIDLNSWGKVSKPTFIKSNYGIWNTNNLPNNYRDVEQQFNEDNSEAIVSSQLTTDRLSNTSDKSAGWHQLTGVSNYTNNNPNGSSSVSQNQRIDNVSPVRTITDYNYWNSKIPTSNSSNDANITVSLMPDFIVVSKNSDGKATIVKSLDDTSSDSIIATDNNNQVYSQAYPIYISIKTLMDKYSEVMGDDSYHSFDDLFKAIASKPDLLTSLVNDDSNNLLSGTNYVNLNGTKNNSVNNHQAFNPYPYTMVFSTNDSVTNQTITSSIYENCEAYVYFSPTVVYQKYLQVKNEYNSIINSASDNLNSNNPDAVTVVQIGYYTAALSILESYLEEALPQDATRGYVGMSEPNNIRGKSDGSEVGQWQNVFATAAVPENTEFQKVTYATLMWDVAAKYSASAAANSDCNLDETNAIMDNLSVFGYTNSATDGARTYVAGVMVGMNQQENFNRRTNLTPRYKEDNSSDEYTEQLNKYQQEYQDKISQIGDNPRNEKNLMHQADEILDKINNLNADQQKKRLSQNSNNAGIYTPVYYPIQQHKMPDNEKSYRFSILADIPYTTVINYMNQSVHLASVTLSYSSNFTSSFTSVTDTFENGSKKTALQQLVDQYNSGDEDTGLDLSTYDATKSIVCSPDNNNSTDTGTDQDAATEDTVQERVDSALLGFSAGNMTSDNVHDLVDIMRALPNGKIETFYRFFNPIKSDGDDQDIFVTRVTPAVTTYFPSLLVNGYENAGGAEVDSSCSTSNVSFDYFSIPSFAPCFASHTASDTYYGSLNYELRAFYKKGFIKTLSSKTNIPQVEEAQDAINKADQAVSDLQDDNSISADTMAKNMKTIFVEAKRYIATLVLQNAMKNYGKDSNGMLNMDTVKTFYDDVYKAMFNNNFGVNYIDKIQGNITGNDSEHKVDGHDYTPKANPEFNNWSWKKSISSYDDLSNGKERSFITEGSEEGKVNYDEVVINSLYTTTYNEVKGLELSDSQYKHEGKGASTPSGTIDQLVNETGKDKKTIIKIWNSHIKAALKTAQKTGDEDKYIIGDDGETKANTPKITGIYWQATDGPKKGEMASGGNFFPSADTTLIGFKGSGSTKSLGLGAGQGWWGSKDLKINAVAVKSDNAAYGPVYWQTNSDLIISNDYLTKVNSMIIQESGQYYWGDYHEIEKSNSGTNESIDVGNLVSDEGSSIYTVGYSSGGGIYVKITEDATKEDYAKEVKKALNDACKEMFKDLVNTAKNMQLIQQSMPSQMQNCLAWADYQNASDSEGQYQSDPTDTVDINLAQQTDTDASDDYDKADAITGIPSLTAAGYHLENDGSVQINKSVTGATNSAIQARMERGVEGSTWTSSVQPACYTITAIIARIDSMQNSGVSYPYNNICSGRLRSGADQYALLQAHVIDYSSIASGISGDLATRVHGKVVSITNPNYGALPDFLNILGTIGGIIAEAVSGFANLTGSMFEDVMWNGNKDSAAKVATSDNQTDSGTIQTKKYDGTGNIERTGSMWVLSSTGGQSIYTLIQSLALVLVLISLLYIAFKNFYEYTKPSAAATSIDDKDDAMRKSTAAEKKILAATQLKVVLPRAIIAVFMIGLPPMGNGTGFQGGNFLLLQMLSSIFNQISYVFINLNGQSVMNLWLNTGADLLSDNPNFGDYLAYGVAMLVIGVMFIVGTIAVYIMDFILISFYLIGPLLWALYVWPYNDTTSKVEKPDGLIAKLTSKMKVAWTAGRVGNKAPEGMIECYCQTAMLNVVWAVIFWAVTIIFTGITGTISTGDTSSTTGNTATLANAASIQSSYTMSVLMSTGSYNASASIAHADGILNSGILPIPAWGRMLIAALLSVVVFMLMIKMASGMFKKSLFNTFGAVSAVGGAIRGGLVGGAIGSAAKAIKVGANAAEGINRVKNIADTARNAADRFGKASARGKLHQIANGARSLGSHGANAVRKAGTASQNAGKYLSGDKNITDGFRKGVNGINRRLNEYAAANQMNTLKRISGTNDDVKALKAALGTNDIAKAQELLDGMTPEQKRRLAQYAPQLFEESRNGHNLQLKQDVRSSDFDSIENRLNDRTESLQDRIDRRLKHSDDAVSPAEVRERALERAGIEDAAVLSSTLLDPNADSRTKRDARRRLADYSRFMGYDTDINSLSDVQAAKLLEGTTTARDRATRIEDAASNAAYAGHNAARGVAHRLGYDGDANDVTVRELGRVNDSINQILPTAVATSTDVSGIRNTLDSHIDKLSDIYIQRGFDPSEARVHAISEIQSQHGPMMSSDEARFLASEITKGKEIPSEDLVRLELFRQNNNIGNGQLGDRILEKGKGLNEASYRYYLPQIDNGLLNHDALHAKEILQNVADYQNYANNYQIAGSAYNDELTRMINTLPAGRERRQFERAMQASPFNALFNSGRAISRNDLDAIMQSEESAGRIVPAEVKAAIENIYSTVSNSAFENNDDFKNGILANMSTNTYSSGEEAFRELQGYEPNYEILQKQISDSVNDNLTTASAEVRKVTAELATITTELSAQRARYAKAFSDADANEQKAASAEIARLESLQVNKQTELTNAQHNETNIENQLHSLHVSAPVSTTTSSKKPL